MTKRTPKAGSSSAKAPKKKAAAKRAPAKKTASKKTASKKSAAKKGAKAPKASRARGTPAVTARAKVRRTTWKQFFVWEGLTWATGALAGLAITGSLLWTEARGDVEAYLQAPPTTVPGVIWSAPMDLRVGQRASLASIAGDLLAAGYDRVDQIDQKVTAPSVGQFRVTGQRMEIWTANAEGDLTPGVIDLRVEQGRIGWAEPPRATLRPTVLGTIGDLESRRNAVDLDELSAWVEPALLAIEDARFREHHGVDPIGITRALVRNLVFGGGVQGGSTLTQQLAKNLFLSPERTLQRKVREAFFAAALEHALTKDELLELYLGEVYLGQMGGFPLHGVEAASRAWFGVSAAQLEVHQAATIVGVIAAPNRWSPVRHPETCVERRNRVIDRMLATGALDEAAAERAKDEPLELKGLEPSRVRRAPYAVDMAVDAAEEVLGHGALANGGYQVHTHIQPLLQRAAEEAVALSMAELDAAHDEARGAQVALVAVRASDGAVVAMVGGRSYATSPFNRVTQAWRQAGSTVKPLTVLGVFDEGNFSPADTLLDAPISRVIDGKTWTPKNYDGSFAGDITIRRAIEKSRNIPAILMAEELGLTRMQRLFRATGLSRASHLPSAALGAFTVTPMELAEAYTAFPGEGTVQEAQLVANIRQASGATLVDMPMNPTSVADPQSAAQTVAILNGVMTQGTGKSSSKYGVGPAVGGKSGTTDGGRDAWFVGVTPELSVAVWVGLDQGSLGLTGSAAALPVWSRFVAASGTDHGAFPMADGLVEVAMCSESGHVARDDCEDRHADLFVKGTAPRQKCDLHGAPLVRPARAIGGLFSRRE